MFAPAVVFVDLETTGADPTRDRVTEVGILRVSEGRLDWEWSALVNPGCPIPPAIQRFTGISDAMVREAPPFALLADEIEARLAGSLFVAHNARFDVSFLRAEFARLEREFRPRVLCTVKLSRALYPREHRHGLDAVMARHGIACSARHRALGDARVLWQFAQIVAREHAPEAIEAAIARAGRPLRLPEGVDGELVEALPDGPGVFVLRGADDAPLYAGSAASLRAGVIAHLGGRGSRYAPQVTRVEVEPAGGLLAELRAVQQVARLRPLHNRGHAMAEAVVLVPCPPGAGAALEIRPYAGLGEADLAAGYGPFTSRREALRKLRALAGGHGLCLARCGVETGAGPCSARRSGGCRGACEGAEAAASHDARLAAALARHRLPVWPYDGPVAWRETDPAGERERMLVFDRWCWLGTAENEAELAELLGASPPHYDEDICRVLRRHLARPEAARHLLRLPRRPGG